MDIRIGERKHNLEKMKSLFNESTGNGAQLTVFPECTVSGYCYESLEDAKPIAESINGPSVTEVQKWCAEKDAMSIFGLLELDGERIFNSLALVGPKGLLGTYRKIHLPFLGIDRFTTPGDRPFEVIETDAVNIGMNICYDSSFPEAARCLALSGADLIVLPTNWPPTSEVTADVVPCTRALENHVFYMAINRIGSECGFEFIGKSKICDPGGRVLASANHNNEEILYAEVDPQIARRKHLVTIPGEHEVHRLNDRRPDTYDPIVKPLD